MSYQLREGEPFYLAILKRKDRFVLSDEGYFYKTRECDLIGPFATESEALFDLNTFIEVAKIEQEFVVDELLKQSN